MAKTGDVIYNTISTDKIIFLTTREESAGNLL